MPSRYRSRRHVGDQIRQSLRDAIVRPSMALALAVLPRLYVAYMKFVFATSRVDRNGFERLHDITQDHDGAVALLWHEEVFTVAYGYGLFAFRAHTLASRGSVGEIITRILERCGYCVFRGGSSRRASRRSRGIVNDMIDHMKRTRNVTYGITVDGSAGPAYRMKVGGIMVARECGKPIALARTWYKRSVRLTTWDRTAIPLPWNHIRYYLAGPFPVPDDAVTTEGLQRFLLEMEDRLIDMAAESYRDMGQALPSNLVKRSEEERKEISEV